MRTPLEFSNLYGNEGVLDLTRLIPVRSGWVLAAATHINSRSQERRRDMAFEIDDLIDNMRGALRFFLCHLNGLPARQWDWKPSPACRSIREMLLHLSETYEDKAALEEELARPVPDVARVQALFEQAARKDYGRLRAKYADTPLDAEITVPGGDFFLGKGSVKAGTLLARRAWEECYHTGQVVYIRLATDPEWDQEKAAYGLPSGSP